MDRAKKHIAILLLGVFFFPIVYQSIHIVWHHSHPISCSCNAHNNDNFRGQPDPHSHSPKHCAVCQFQFAISNLHNTFIFESVVPAVKTILNKTSKSQPHQQVFAETNPRAPPALALT